MREVTSVSRGGGDVGSGGLNISQLIQDFFRRKSESFRKIDASSLAEKVVTSIKQMLAHITSRWITITAAVRLEWCYSVAVESFPCAVDRGVRSPFRDRLHRAPLLIVPRGLPVVPSLPLPAQLSRAANHELVLDRNKTVVIA
jgi:hypothetical protein